MLKHVSDEGDDMQAGKGLGVSLVISDKTPAMCGPGEGSFPDPASSQQEETALCFGQLDQSGIRRIRHDAPTGDAVPRPAPWARCREVGRLGEGCAAVRHLRNAAFARALQHDIEAVRIAVLETWSNGQTGGQINRLKTLKRSMLGRAGVDLLRARLMPLHG